MWSICFDDAKFPDNCLTDAEFPELPEFYRGKVRDAYGLPGGRRLLISTDRQSAFDQVLASVPFKGQVLNQTAKFWFDETADICPNHVISYPDPNVAIVKDLDMLPLEMIVRDYLTGSTETSIWPMYERGERILYGHEFPEGLQKNQKLPATIITPTTKAALGEHDAPYHRGKNPGNPTGHRGAVVRVGGEKWRFLHVDARSHPGMGSFLVDTKFEFGLDETGTVVLADEILTPDSSRYWIADTYQQKFQAGRIRTVSTRSFCAFGFPDGVIPIRMRSQKYRPIL